MVRQNIDAYRIKLELNKHMASHMESGNQQSTIKPLYILNCMESHWNQVHHLVDGWKSMAPRMYYSGR